MILVELTREEVEILRDLVDERVSDLGPEIHHTRSREYYDMLKRTREQLRELLQRLSQAAA